MSFFLETLLAFAQKAINYALSLDEHTQNALTELQSRCIAFHITPLEHTIYLLIENQQIFLSLQPAKAVDLSISGTPKNLWQLSQKKQNPQHTIEIQGDMHLAQKFGQILHEFYFDVDEILTRTVGDMAGQALAQTLKRAQNDAKELAQAILQQSKDFVIDEAQLITSKASLSHFITEVDALRTDCDRLFVRVHLCNQRVNHG